MVYDDIIAQYISTTEVDSTPILPREALPSAFHKTTIALKLLIYIVTTLWNRPSNYTGPNHPFEGRHPFEGILPDAVHEADWAFEVDDREFGGGAGRGLGAGPRASSFGERLKDSEAEYERRAHGGGDGGGAETEAPKDRKRTAPPETSLARGLWHQNYSRTSTSNDIISGRRHESGFSKSGKRGRS